MNLDVSKWDKYQVGELFDVVYGVNLELNACVETTKDDPESVNFVSRSRDNNGVTAYIKRIEDLEPQSAGIITVAGGGSSVLSTFVQDEPFYSGRDLYLLIPKKQYEHISKEARLFVCVVLMENKYRYSFGRQANKTLPYIELNLPSKNNEPDWQFMENYMKTMHYKPLTTKNKSKNGCFLNVGEWKNFVVGNILNCDTTILSIKDDLLDGSTPFISRTASNNGCDGYVEVTDDYLTEANCVTIGAEGIYAFYQPEKFATGNKVYALKNKHMNQYVGLFLSTILNKEDYRYSYGRARILGKLKAEQIKLPVKHNADGTIFIDDEHTYSEDGYVPDWQFMEDYIKSLPYGDRL